LILAATVVGLPVLVLAGAFLGGRLDAAIGTEPWGAVGGALAGVAAGSVEMAIVIRKFWK
jgi:F0F1-type ATP synthase assembly protein I